jgi:hypothetical protein
MIELIDIAQKLGQMVAEALKDTIREGVDPPNAASTIRKKGFDWPLIDTGEMLESITSRVESEGDSVSVEVGIFDEKLAAIADINEHHPKHPRPFGQITADTKVPRILEEIDDDLEQYYLDKFMR